MPKIDDVFETQRLRARLIDLERRLRELDDDARSEETDPASRLSHAHMLTMAEESRDDIKERIAARPKATFPCLVCDKPLDNVVHEWVNQPYGGVRVRVTGNFGSTVLDEGIVHHEDSHPYLEFNICDDCLVAKAGAIWHVQRRVGDHIVKAGRWNPDLPRYPKPA